VLLRIDLPNAACHLRPQLRELSVSFDGGYRDRRHMADAGGIGPFVAIVVVHRLENRGRSSTHGETCEKTLK
jgi:hypothetical protein